MAAGLRFGAAAAGLVCAVVALAGEPSATPSATNSPVTASAPAPAASPLIAPIEAYPATEGKPPTHGVLKRFEPSPVPTEAAKKAAHGKSKSTSRNKAPTKHAESASKKSKPPSAPKAKAVTPPASLPPVFREIEAKYAEAKTLMAEFTQVNVSVATQQTKKSNGVIMVKRPGKLRWETLKPDMNLLVSDGRTFWFYTPPFDDDENGQLIVRKSTEVQSQLANALLSGAFSAAKDMSIEELSPSLFRLVPRHGAGGTVTEARLEIDPQEKLIKKVTLEHKGGNRSEISLSKIELGKSIDDQMFHFEAPPKTDVVDK